VKYNVEGGAVTVSAHKRSPQVVWIGVTDSGPGIAPDKVELLFTPFERLGAEQTTVEGTGLGLALSKSLVEAMGGCLTVDTMRGEGTTFGLELSSVAAPAALAGGPDEEELQPAADTPRKVLYIEDNLSNLTLIERLLARRPGLKLISAMTGNLGLDLARQHAGDLDLILLDLHLPDLQGDEVLLRLRRDPKSSEIPVVIVSADATPGQIQRLLASGADDYLTKPLDVRSFMRMLDRVLDLRRAPS
jgi:CheY-like chemotaxis protein